VLFDVDTMDIVACVVLSRGVLTLLSGRWLVGSSFVVCLSSFVGSFVRCCLVVRSFVRLRGWLRRQVQ